MLSNETTHQQQSAVVRNSTRVLQPPGGCGSLDANLLCYSHSHPRMIKTSTRVLQPPGGYDHDIFGKMLPADHYRRQRMRVEPYTPASKKLIVNKLRIRDQASEGVSAALGRQDELQPDAVCKSARTARNRRYEPSDVSSVCNSDSSSSGDVHSSKSVPVSVDRYSNQKNNSQNVRFLIEPEIYSDAGSNMYCVSTLSTAMDPVYERKLMNYDSSSIWAALGNNKGENVMWYPKYRLAQTDSHVVTDGVFPKAAADISLEAHAKRQKRNQKNASTVFEPSISLVVPPSPSERHTKKRGRRFTTFCNMTDPLTGHTIFTMRD